MSKNEIIILRRKVVPASELSLRRSLKALGRVALPEPTPDDSKHIRDRLRFRIRRIIDSQNLE